MYNFIFIIFYFNISFYGLGLFFDLLHIIKRYWIFGLDLLFCLLRLNHMILYNILYIYFADHWVTFKLSELSLSNTLHYTHFADHCRVNKL